MYYQAPLVSCSVSSRKKKSDKILKEKGKFPLATLATRCLGARWNIKATACSVMHGGEWGGSRVKDERRRIRGEGKSVSCGSSLDAKGHIKLFYSKMLCSETQIV